VNLSATGSSRTLAQALLIALMLGLLGATASPTDRLGVRRAAASPADPLAAPFRRPLDRIVILGASMSCGFGVRMRATAPDGQPLSMRVNLAELIATASGRPDLVAADLSTQVYFTDPRRIAARTAREALAARPDLVLALDWIFWNGYGLQGPAGPARDCTDRLSLLEAALEQLEPLAASGVPVVLGDFPDMHAAIGGGMIAASMVPDPACLAQLNRQLAAWATPYPNVAILKLSSVVQATLADRAVVAQGREWSKATVGTLVQRDRLHPTLAGTMVVLAASLDQADRLTGGRAGVTVPLDPQVVRDRLRARLLAMHATATVPNDSSDEAGPAAAADRNNAGDLATPD
jgi:hypothetical protein